MSLTTKVSPSFLFDAGRPLADLVGLGIHAGRRQLTLLVLVSLSRHSTSSSPEIRHSALSSLSRVILGPLVVVPRADVAEMFQRVLYPLLEALIGAPSNVETTESRLRASGLVCKAFMRFEISDNVGGEDVTERWEQVLDYLSRLLRTDQSDQLVRIAFVNDTCDGRLTMPSRLKLCTNHSKTWSSSCTRRACSSLLWRRNMVATREPRDGCGTSHTTRSSRSCRASCSPSSRYPRPRRYFLPPPTSCQQPWRRPLRSRTRCHRRANLD
jgi:hypothetical protein